MDRDERKSIVKIILGLFGALFFCAFGFMFRRKKLVAIACAFGVTCSLIYTYTGYRDYKSVHIYNQRYGDQAIDVSCKTFIIGSLWQIQPRNCKINPRSATNTISGTR